MAFAAVGIVRQVRRVASVERGSRKCARKCVTRSLLQPCCVAVVWERGAQMRCVMKVCRLRLIADILTLLMSTFGLQFHLFVLYYTNKL